MDNRREQSDLRFMATQMEAWTRHLREKMGADTSALEPLVQWARAIADEQLEPGQRRDELALHLPVLEELRDRLKADGLPCDWMDGPINVAWYHSKEDPENDPTMPGRVTWPGQDQNDAAIAKNRGVQLETGKHFYCGVFDALTGDVIEVKTYQATGYGSRHHGEFLSRTANLMVNKGEGGFFFIHDNGYVYTQWRLTRGEIAPGALDRLAQQITVDGQPPRIFEEVASAYCILRYEERTPAASASATRPAR